MESIHFEVGAKAARLIGRENIADVDGALIELIKNAYDADASCVCVYFDMPFPYVPSKVEAGKLKQYLSEDDRKIVLSFYEKKGDGYYCKKDTLSDEQEDELRRLFAGYNRIVVADNGTGMTSEDVKTKWMYIGTSDKAVNSTSDKGRIKTGAKGIGRFALDKLSLVSTMYTQTVKSKLLEWEINWEQFEESKLLNQVSARLNELDKSYKDIVKDLLGNGFGKAFTAKDDWSKGTIIILHPIREEWTYRLFEKVNTNLKSINPLGTVDPFKVFVHNRYYPKYDFETAEAIDVKDYDYKINIQFDGNNMLTTILTRNEVDIKKKQVVFQKFNQKVSLESFWSRPFFQRDKYQKEDFASQVTFTSAASRIVEDDPAKIRNVGPFEAELYFLKSQKSNIEIIKPFVIKTRKQLLAKFSGVKMYRDRFKVRPYGDEGSYFDWLELGKRQAESPGGVGSDSGSWRVLAYQLIGQVKIGREQNAALYDMANREGLTLNDEYHIFVELLQEAIHIFETDRQGFYREYMKWYDEIEKTFGTDANIRAESRQNAATNEKRTQEEPEDEDKKEEEQSDNKDNDERQNKYTDKEYQETVYNLMQEVESILNAKQILQMLSSSGLILNTFFHEFKAIQSHFGSRASQLRHRIDYMITHETFTPGFVYDPKIIVDKMEQIDEMLALWLKIAMNSIEKPYLQEAECMLEVEIADIIGKWQELLATKDIKAKIDMIGGSEFPYVMASADLYIILNNFLLNSVYFLEKGHNLGREIIITLENQEEYYHLNLWNNGPGLDEKYKEIPDRIFELGVSSKRETGSGVGLWITKETVERYNGTVVVSTQETGFGIDIYLKKDSGV